MSAPAHIGWLVRAGKTLKTVDDLIIHLWELNIQPDNKVLSAWAKHFRNQYCDDAQIDILRDGTPHSRKDYLVQIKFPDASNAPGPSIRSGDFGEILIADYIEYILGYWVPRTRYNDKTVRNESEKGADTIGFKLKNPNRSDPSDKLLVFETKAQASGNKPNPILQNAINDSAKDKLRCAESLNAIKQKFLNLNDTDKVQRIARFQDLAGNPYTMEYGAAAVCTSEVLDHAVLKASDGTSHPGRGSLNLIVVSAGDLMAFVHKLYQRAADEA